jgi:thiamine-monophosphate kinase
MASEWEGLAERQLTDALGKLFATKDPGVLIGIGDDAAVVRTTGRTALACDPVVEGVHFRRSDPMDLVGRKAVNRNLSDLAAMGANPRFLLVSVLLPDWLSPAERTRLFSGIRRAAAAESCTVVGGDVAWSPGPLVVTVTAVGEAPSRPLRRNGLRPGDALHVTGALGGASLGGHLRFRPRVQIGAWLAGQRGVSGVIDISDGLLLDLTTLLRASGSRLGAVLDAARIPVSAAARRTAAESGRDPLAHALSDGEDHELLFALRTPLRARGPLTARTLIPVGVVREGPGIDLMGRDGVRRPCPPTGYQHDVRVD